MTKELLTEPNVLKALFSGESLTTATMVSISEGLFLEFQKALNLPTSK